MKIFIKILKTLIAILLIPFCIGAITTLWQTVHQNSSFGIIWVIILTGFFAWTLIYFFIPEPRWIYVLGHELTHALWSLSFGGKLKKIKVSSGGGHVSITKSNFIVSLAPYFFPLYVFLIIIFFLIMNIFWNLNTYVYIFYFLIGVAYAFHITLTFKILKTRQPDIIKEGYLFSFIIIFLGNVITLLVGIVLITKNSTLLETLNILFQNSIKIYKFFI